MYQGQKSWFFYNSCHWAIFIKNQTSQKAYESIQDQLHRMTGYGRNLSSGDKEKKIIEKWIAAVHIMLKVNDWNSLFLLDFRITLLTFVELITCYVKYHLNSMHHLIMKHSMFCNPYAELFSVMMGLGAKSIIFNLLCGVGLRTIFCIIKIYFQRMVLVVAPRTKHSEETAFELGTLTVRRR